MIDIQESFLAFLIFIGMQHQSEFRDKTFIFKPKLSFLMKNHKNENFKVFLKMAITIKTIFVKNIQNHI